MSCLNALRGARWALIACVFLAGSVLAAVTGTTSYHHIPTPSGKIDTRYPDGDDGSAGLPLTWSACPDVSVETGTSGSQNVRAQCLTEVGSPNATLSVSCTPTLAGGFSATADGLSWSSTTAYSGLCQWTATRFGFTAINTTLQRVEAVEPPSSDTTAPTVPTGCTVVNNIGSFTITCDASSDPYDGGASGVASYDISLNGTAPVNVAGSAGLSPQLTCTNLGSLTPTPTCVQAGSQWTLVSAGSTDGTADAHGFLNAQVSGDVTVIAKVASITNTADYAHNGIQFRNSLDAGSAKFNCTATRLANGTYYLSSAQRAVDGGNRVTVATVQPAPGFPVWLRGREVASVYACDYSLDGNTWVSISSGTSIPAIGSSPYVGLYDTATTGSGGATQTGVLQQLNVNNVARWSYTYVTGSSGTVAVRARDVDGNVSAYGASVSVAPISSGDTTPPAAPTSPACTSGGQTSINCTATAPSDPSGIRGYIWSFAPTSGGTYVDQAEQALIAFTLTGLSASTQRCGKVKAIDNAGNIGAFSSSSCATTDSAGGNPTSAPTITSFAQNADRSASYTLAHSLVTNAHHYNVQVADCANGKDPGNYATVAAYQHTTGSVNLTGFTLFDAPSKSVKVTANNQADTVVHVSAATGCVPIFEPWTTAELGTRHVASAGNFIETGNKDDIRPDGTNTRAQNSSYFSLPGPRWEGVERSQSPLAHFEGNTLGDYSKGVNYMDFYLGAAASAGKYLWVQVEDKMYGNALVSSMNGGFYFPTYLFTSTYSDGFRWCDSDTTAGTSSPGLAGCSGSLSGMTTTWDPDTADRYSALGQWMCGAYGNNTRFIGLSWGGFSVSPLQISGFTIDGYIPQVKRILAAWRQACPKQQIAVRVDWLGSQQRAHDFIKWARAYRLTISDYDVHDWPGRVGTVTPGTGTDNPNHGQQAFRGVSIVGGLGQPNTAGVSGVDYRGKMAYFAHIESPDWQRDYYGTQSINEYFDITGGNLGSTSISIAPYSGFAHGDFTPTNTTVFGNPASDIVRRCIENGTGIGCTPAIRDTSFSTSCPTDWIGCFLPLLPLVRRRRRVRRRVNSLKRAA